MINYQKNDTQEENESQVTFEAMVREKQQQAVRTTLISVLEAEIDTLWLSRALRDQVSTKEIGQQFVWLHKHTATRACL